MWLRFLSKEDAVLREDRTWIYTDAELGRLMKEAMEMMIVVVMKRKRKCRGNFYQQRIGLDSE